jgi:SAM-dependent methyltransferase
MRDPRRHSPAALRNAEPIAAVLADLLPKRGAVLEVASGSGEHAVHFARRFPFLRWQPTDADPEALASIEAHRGDAGLDNLQPVASLDVLNPKDWDALRDTAWCALLAVNLLHIAPWSVAERLVEQAASLLDPGGLFVLYGPFVEDDVVTAPSNEEFDRALRARDARWGLRRLADVRELARRRGFAEGGRVAMPANNLTVWFRRDAAVPR